MIWIKQLRWVAAQPASLNLITRQSEYTCLPSDLLQAGFVGLKAVTLSELRRRNSPLVESPKAITSIPGRYLKRSMKATAI